ncbi:hypothetical protein AMTRI_Chr12g266970 [Amborella trichopoda]
MLDLSDFISHNELLDIPLQGNLFTWSDHSSQPTLSKLNRFLTSLQWDDAFLGNHAMALSKPTSDHCSILLQTHLAHRGPKPFRFELVWLEESSLSSLIPQWWDSFTALVSGMAGFILQRKIQLLKVTLKNWSKTIPGNFSLTKSFILSAIRALDLSEESLTLSNAESNLRTQLKLDYFSTLKKEEIFWFQRFRVKWLRHGDHNTGYFHIIANCQHREHSISMLTVENIVLDQLADIEEAILSFYRSLYSAPSELRP